MPPDELLLDLVERRYDEELERRRDLDGKASNLIGYITIVTGVIVGLGTFSILEKLSSPQYYIPYLLGIAALLGSIIASLFAVNITKYEYSPGIAELRNYYRNDQLDYNHLAGFVLPLMILAVKKNFDINESKALNIRVSWISLVIGIGSLVIYVGIFALTGGGVSSGQLVKVLVGDAIQNLKNNHTKEALTSLKMAPNP